MTKDLRRKRLAQKPVESAEDHMFSGIIETTGTITTIEQINEGARLFLTSRLPLSEVSLGESICVNGTCLTVTVIGDTTLALMYRPSRSGEPTSATRSLETW